MADLSRLQDHDLRRIHDLIVRRRNDGSTHWETCHVEHIDCAASFLLMKVAKLSNELVDEVREKAEMMERIADYIEMQPGPARPLIYKALMGDEDVR